MNKFIFTSLFFMFSIGVSYCQNNVKPDSFKEIQKEIPSIELDIRYFGNHNFIGIPIEGYLQPIALLTKEALEKLKNVQKQLELQNLGLKIFDGYRPQRAVNHFVRWAKNEKDTLMKAEFYPAVAKKDLFRLDYIAAKSGHSRGSTVDLTIINLDSRIPLDMGSPYDYFDTISWPFEKSITPKQQSNRLLLRKVMVENNFKPYQSEWWHFTLKNEPYPITYFDFLVE